MAYEPQPAELFPTSVFNQTVRHHPQQDWVMSRHQLIRWKNRVLKHQQKVRQQLFPKQQSLFDTGTQKSTVDTLDPLTLKFHNWQFYRMPYEEQSCCLYFILDIAFPLLLYVGETKQTARQRWGAGGTNHDCEGYIAKYLSLHRQYDLDVKVCASFWYDVPEETQSRQKIESALIKKWRYRRLTSKVGSGGVSRSKINQV